MSRSLGNGTSTSYGYDAVSRLTALNLNGGGQADAVTLGYNPASQIATRTSANDAFAWTGAVNLDRNYATNGLNQYTASGNVTPTYDARGNLTSAGGASYLYNSKNQLSGANGTYLYYDAVGRLDQVTQSGLTWEWDGSRLVTERSGGGIVKRYIHGPGADEPIVQYDGAGTGQRRWLDADERGSIVRVTDDAGGVVAVNAYDEYGIPGAANYGRFQYTGQMWMPELGFYHYKARMYSPTLGRFLQTDPIGYGDGINWYDYVGGDPVNATDPSGMQSKEVNPCPGGRLVSNRDSFTGQTQTSSLEPIPGYRCEAENEPEGEIVVNGRLYNPRIITPGAGFGYTGSFSFGSDDIAGPTTPNGAGPQREESAQERRVRLMEEDRKRRERNVRCAKLRTNAALKGIGFGAAGTAATGAGEAYKRYGTARSAYRGGVRALGSVPGLVVTFLLVSYDVLTATEGDSSCR